MLQKIAISIAALTVSGQILASPEAERLGELIAVYEKERNAPIAFKIGLLYTNQAILDYDKAKLYLETAASSGYTRAFAVLKGLPTKYVSTLESGAALVNTYTVKRGDTLGAIALSMSGGALSFHARLSLLKRANNTLFEHRSYDDLRIGDIITIPIGLTSTLVSESIGVGVDSTKAKTSANEGVAGVKTVDRTNQDVNDAIDSEMLDMLMELKHSLLTLLEEVSSIQNSITALIEFEDNELAKQRSDPARVKRNLVRLKQMNAMKNNYRLQLLELRNLYSEYNLITVDDLAVLTNN